LLNGPIRQTIIERDRPILLVCDAAGQESRERQDRAGFSQIKNTVKSTVKDVIHSPKMPAIILLHKLLYRGLFSLPV
jgi:hypothetical protein